MCDHSLLSDQSQPSPYLEPLRTMLARTPGVAFQAKRHSQD
jgi:hypothetical protein